MNVLILGNRGQIGSFLQEFLQSKGVNVVGLDIATSKSQDLRYMHSDTLDSYLRNSDFVFFLAYDVGGSTYLTEKQSHFEFMQNNALIMSNCFGSLNRVRTPFVFASSQMSNMNFSNYGLLKAVGERYTKSLGGVTVKFWNVYGYETDRDKFHVISDFVRMAIEDGEIRMKTTGEESRDFLFAADCCEGLYQLMSRFPVVDKNESYDLASGTWTTILEVAEVISGILKVPIKRGAAQDSLQQLVRNVPRTNQLEFWSPKTSLEAGIREIVQTFSANISLKIQE